MIQMAVLGVAAALTAGLTACDGLWVAADDGYYDGPDIDYNPYYGYWGGRGNNGYWPIVGTGYVPALPPTGPYGPPPPPQHHRPVNVGPVNNSGWSGGLNIPASQRPGGMGLGVSGYAPNGVRGESGGGASGADAAPTVIVH